MGTTKTNEYSKRDNRIANYAKALAHPARIAILRLLVNKEACVCGDIVEELPLSQSTVSQHLKELKAVGIIKGDVSGKSVCHCIDEKVWKEVKESLGTLFETLNLKKKCC